jgi:hypothetical protein
MKRFWPLAAWFVAGALLGQLADGVLFRLWSKVGILLPVGHWLDSHGDDVWVKVGVFFPIGLWLDSHGGDILVKCWFIVWANATNWALAVLVGVLAGCFVKRHILRYLLAFGVGFAFVPFGVNGYIDSETPRFSLVVWHLVSVALVVVCGLLFQSWKSPNKSLHATAAAPAT